MSRYEQQVNPGVSWLVISVFLILIVLACWLYWPVSQENDTETEKIDIPKEIPVAVSTIDPVVNRVDEVLISEPVAQSQDQQTEQNNVLTKKIILPALEQSDDVFRRELSLVSANLSRWFGGSDVIKKYLVIVNDLSQKQILFKHRIFLKTPGKIVVGEDKQGLYLSEDSYQRYNIFVNAITAIDADKGLQLFLAFKPLFEQVYKEFAYPSDYQLQDLFLKAAANVIEAPIINGRIDLVQHSVRYKFSDKKLESLSDVEKQMIRMGPENTKKIQAKLRELVQLLVAQSE